jgi:putative ABC transport system permease protein
MLLNILKITYRQLLRQGSYTIINIAGLSISLAACLLIALFVDHELSYDRFHEKGDRVYRLAPTVNFPNGTVSSRAVSSPPMAIMMHNDFPEFERIVKITQSSRRLSVGDKVFYNTKMLSADSAFFDIFSFPVLYGNAATALHQPNSVVISESVAEKYFGRKDVVNEIIQMSDTISLGVTAVIKDIPENSHLHFDALYSRATFVSASEEPAEDWFHNDFYTYALLSEGADVKKVEAGFPAMLDRYMGNDRKNTRWYELRLQPLYDIHLNSNLQFEYEPVGSIKTVYVFVSIGLLLLFIAFSNFMSLATARGAQRAKEVGVRKVSGAMRSQLTGQFLGESVLLSLFSTAVAVCLAQLFIPFFNALVDRELVIDVTQHWKAISGFVIVGIGGGLIAGIYPAFFLSGFRTADVLKGRLNFASNTFSLRRALIVLQFAIATFLLAGTLVIRQQLEFMASQDLGFEKHQRVVIDVRDIPAENLEALRQRFIQDPAISTASFSSTPPGSEVSTVLTLAEGFSREEMVAVNTIVGDANFVKTFGIELLAGRDFIDNNIEDLNHAFIINESAVKLFQFTDPENAIGKTLDWGTGKPGKVVGVAKDFNFRSLHQAVDPLVIHIMPDWYQYLTLKVESEATYNEWNSHLSSFESVWKEFAASPFEFTFLSDAVDSQYKEEKRLETFFVYFSTLGIIVGCVGLLGLVAFSLEQRRKEIGIRKVLGGTVSGVVWLLSAEYLKLVVIANVIAIPVAIFLANRWLEDFVYRADNLLLIFVVSSTASMVVVWATVSIQSVRAAVSNPIDSIRTE